MISRHDLQNSIIIGEAIVLMSFPTLQNIGLVAAILAHGTFVTTLALIAWIIAIPAGFIVGLHVLHIVPLGSYDFRYQLGRYGIVGFFNTFLNAAVFNLLIWITDISSGFWILVFSVISFLIVVSQAFFWNKYWSFQSTTPYSHREFFKFVAVSGIAAAVNLVLIQILVNVIGAPHGMDPKLWANIALAITIIVSVVGNFFGYRIFVFNKKSPPPSS
jgi:putative flippase GtrA